MIESILCFKLLSRFLGKSKGKVFGTVAITSFLFPVYYSPIILVTWLKCCKVFLVILLCFYKICIIFLISVFGLHELFPAFIFANDNTGSLVNSAYRVNAFFPFDSFTPSASLSSGSIDNI